MKRRLYDILILVAVLGLLTACSADEPQQGGVDDALEDAHIELRAMTRVADDQVSSLDDIHVFLSCPSEDTKTEGFFRLHNESSSNIFWTAEDLKVKPGRRTFWLYGYMPAAEDLQGEIVGQRQLILSGIKPMSVHDICIVTGVKSWNESVTPERGTFDFEYINSDYNDMTVLNLLLEHMLGHIDFKFKVGTRYSQLRDIKVTKLAIQTSAKSTIKATINLPEGVEGVVRITYTSEGTDTDYKTILRDATHADVGHEFDEAITLTTTGVEIGSVNVAVGSGLSDLYELVSTYEVYDKKGNLLSTRHATNKLSDILPVMGQSKEITLIVEPTYLYQLSEDDLNDPEVKIVN